MSAADFISRLDKVRETSRGNWIARCPAHNDKNPSLTIREMDDGKVLLHCFAECEPHEILSAVGLDFDAVFPQRATHHRQRRRRAPFNPHDMLECLAGEAMIVAIASSNIRQGVVLSDADHERMHIATRRLDQARELING